MKSPHRQVWFSGESSGTDVDQPKIIREGLFWQVEREWRHGILLLIAFRARHTMPVVSWELVGISAYVLLQFVIGMVVVKRIRSEEDYYLAGRSLGLTLTMFSVFATWFGAETCIGSAGAVYAEGLAGGRVDPFGYTICLLLAGLLLAARLRRGGYITMADFFRERFGPRVEWLAALILIPTGILWASAQIRAFGQVLAVSSDFSVTAGMIIASVVVIAYSAVGGLRADVITDFVQGIFLILGLGLLVVVVVADLGGIGTVMNLIDAERLSFVSPDDSSIWSQIDTWIVPIMGSLVSQELVARMVAAKNERISRNGTLLAAAMYLVIGSIPLFLGLIGPHLVPGLEDTEQFLPAVAHKYLGTALYIMFAGALVSAILSTVDSALLAAGSLTSHNLLRTIIPDTAPMRRVLFARLSVVAAGIVALVLALTSESIYGLLELSSGIGGSGVLVITFYGMYTRYGGGVAAFWSLAAGAGTLMFGNIIAFTDAPFLFSIAISGATLLVMLAVERGRSSTSARIS